MSSIATVIILIFIIRYFGRGKRSRSTSAQVYIGKFWALGLVIGIMASAADTMIAMLLAPAIVLICTPTLVLDWIGVPSRMPRFAYWSARLCWPLAFAKENVAGGVVYGALALARRGASDADIEWLERKLERTRSVQNTGVAAAGLIAALRGDRQRARCLLLIADSWPSSPWQLPLRKTRAIARDWLVADAARRGDWGEVIRLGRRGRDSLRWSYAVARIAERLTGDKRACSDWQLWLCFLLAPRRLATLPLLRRALARPQRTLSPPDASRAPAVALPQALADLARVIEAWPAVSGQTLARTVAAVDGSLNASRPAIAHRLDALAARRDADTVMFAFRQNLIDLVVPLIERNPHLVGTPERSPALEQAVARTRARLLRDIEAQCRDYRARKEKLFDQTFEWERWALLRDVAERLLALDPTAEGSMFQIMYAPVCNFAVSQHNQHNRIVLAHDMFCWLLLHARSDPQAVQLLSKNAKAAN